MINKSKLSPNNNLHGFTLKVISFTCNAFSILIHLLCTVGRIFSGIRLSSIITVLLIASTSSKQVSWMTPLSLGKRKKSHGARSNEQGGCSSTTIFLAKNYGNKHCELVHYCGEVATICLVTTLVSFCALSKANATGFLCRLAD